MESDVFPVGSRVRIVSYGPFRGLRGTIRAAHCLPPREEPWCFYQIVLEGAHIRGPIWFEHDEVELLASPSPVPQRGLTAQESMAQHNLN